MAKKNSGGHSWLFPAVLGVAVGYMLSPMIARFSPIKPLHG